MHTQVLARLSGLVDDATLQREIRWVGWAPRPSSLLLDVPPLCVCALGRRGRTRRNDQDDTTAFLPPPKNTNRPCLEELVASDPDGDVKFFAALALEGKEAASPGGPASVDAVGVGLAVSAQG